MPEKVFIYCLKDPTTGDVRYIGQTNNLKKRLRRHLSDSVESKTHLGNWLRSLGAQKPLMVVLHEVSEKETWAEEERRYISCARALGLALVNATDGGEGTSGFVATYEQRAAISAALTGVPKSSECRAAISAAVKGRRKTLAHCAALSVSMRGVPKSPECRAKMSAASKGVPKSPAHREAMKGRTLTPEHRAALSAALTGVPSYPRSTEHRLAMSEAVKASWARRRAGQETS